MRSINGLALLLTAGVVACAPAADAQGGSCQATTKGLPMTGIPEASGVAVSRRTAGLLWSHNDGAPTIFALGADGAVKGSIRVAGAQGGDFEAVAVGSCPQGNCVYFGDIGDNGGKRKDVTIYRFAEPEAGAKETADTETMRATYPDGPRDAEGMFVLGNGTVYIVSKGEQGPVTLYRLPAFRGGTSAQLTRVATVLNAGEGDSKGKKGKNDKGKNDKEKDGKGKGGKTADDGSKGIASSQKVTDASASPDGRWIALRTLKAISFYSASELTAGNVREAFRYDLSGLGEAQGEGISLGANGVVWLTSEGGGKSRPGTLARLQCQLP